MEKKESDREGKGRYPPWSLRPSLKEMTEELGIDHDVLISCFRNDCSSQEIARRLGITPETAEVLKDHFLKYGVASIMGGD